MYKEIHIPPLLNPGSIADLQKQLSEIEKESVRFVVLKGGDEIFCNGLDISWVANSTGGQIEDIRPFGEFLKHLQCGKFISIALVNGIVSGGGMGIVCAADHVIADEPSTFALPEGLLGLIPGMILPSLLNRLSPQRIKKMVFTGKKYSSQTALDWGVIDEVIPSKEQHSALTTAINAMRSCKTAAAQDMKKILYTAHLSKDELANEGMKILNERLQNIEIRQRLKDIADFM
jgi:enoyl-CoA hydratase/carnithine racemase